MPPGAYTLIIILAAGWTGLTCLRIVASYLDSALRWHALKVETHRLRRKQLMRLQAISQRRIARGHRAPAVSAAPAHFDVDIIENEAQAA